MPSAKRLLTPFFLVFFLINVIIFLCLKPAADHQVNVMIILAANAILLSLSVLVFFLQRKALSNVNPNVFIRSVMSGMMIKMFLSVIAVLAYTLASGDSFNKKGIFISMLLYLVYLAVEVMVMLKLNKRNA